MNFAFKLLYSADFIQILEIWINFDDIFTKTHFFNEFQKIIKALLSHDSVVSFISYDSTAVIKYSWNTWPCWVSGSTQSLSYQNNSINCFLSMNCFQSRRYMMHIFEKAEVLLLYVDKKLLILVYCIGWSKRVCKDICQNGE